METLSLVIVSFTCILGLSTFWLLMTTGSLKKKNQKLDRQLTITESESIRTKELLSQFEKKFSKNQAQQNIMNSHQSELLELRRDNAHFKDDLKKLKTELNIKENELKRLESVHIDKIYILKQEKDKLLSQLKELDQMGKKQMDELKEQLNQFKTQEHKQREELAQIEKQVKFQIAKGITLQEKLRFSEQEIAKLNQEVENCKVNSVNSQELLRWKQRALCAKNMYQMMRQMRSLSDNKVESYQEGIIAISEWILTHTNTPMPSIKENENKADRLLAEAWTVVIGNEGYHNVPINHYEKNLDERI